MAIRGAEEFFAYNPSIANQRLINQVQGYRDRDIDALERRGEKEAQAKRDMYTNMSQIPEKLAQGYFEGAEEGRRGKAFDLDMRRGEQQYGLAEEQNKRAIKEHELGQRRGEQDLETGKLNQKQLSGIIGDQESSRAYWRQPSKVPGLTNEQYQKQLELNAAEAGIGATKAGTALAGEQVQSAKMARQTQEATALYFSALKNNDAAKIAQIDADLAKKGFSPGAIALAKQGAQSAVVSGEASQNLLWESSSQGAPVVARLETLQNRATTLNQIKANLSILAAKTPGTDDYQRVQQTITELMKRPEMGEQGQIYASDIGGGLGGFSVGLEGLKSAKDRTIQAVQAIEAQTNAEVNQMELQNAPVRAPGYLNRLGALKTSLASSTRDIAGPKPNVFAGGKGPQAPSPAGMWQMMPAGMPQQAPPDPMRQYQYRGGGTK